MLLLHRCAFMFLSSHRIIDLCCKTDNQMQTEGCIRTTEDLLHVRIKRKKKQITLPRKDSTQRYEYSNKAETQKTQATGSSVRNFPLHSHSDKQHIFTYSHSVMMVRRLSGTPVTV